MRRSSTAERGLSRRRRGRGFEYLAATGEPVAPADRARIEELAIPPAWQDVWICASANGHLQAVGTDAAGRRQYLYHPRWREGADRRKHERVLEFAQLLPEARRRVAAALRRPDLDRARVLAAAFRILDQASLRVGSEQYAVRHATFGLATLRRDHVRVRGGRRVALSFTGKGGTPLRAELTDPALARVVASLLRRRDGDQRLLAHREHRRAPWQAVTSRDINDSLRDLIGATCTAKDFRTWNATVLMAATMARLGADHPGWPARRVASTAVREVSAHLGNTPAVARQSYIDGRVVDLYADGVVLPLEVATTPPPVGRLVAPVTEAAVLHLLADPRRAERQFARIERSTDGLAVARRVLLPA